MAEIELNVLTGQCLKRRMDDIEFVRKEVLAWANSRNNKNAKVKWQFTTEYARREGQRRCILIDIGRMGIACAAFLCKNPVFGILARVP
jgi:hypothetical protein